MTKNKYSPKSESLEFQSLAIEQLRDKPYGAIFYEQGLGKTKIAIDLLLNWINLKYLPIIACELLQKLTQRSTQKQKINKTLKKTWQIK